MSLSVEEITALLDELKGTQATQQRMAGYEDIVGELGREVVESERFAYMTQKTSRTKHSWEVSDDPTDFLVHIPFLPQIIEAQRTVLGAMRSHRVPLPGPDGQIYADRLEKGVAHLWREWGMSRFLSEMAWYAVVLGTGVGVLQWDKKDKFPRPAIRSPENFYALPSVDDERRVQIGMFVMKTLGRILNKQYPKETKMNLNPDEEYEVVDYYDEEMRYRVVRDENIMLIEAKNPIKRVPIYVFPGIVIPNSLFGASFITQALPLQQEMDRLYSKQAEYLEMVMNAPTFIKDPDNVPENFTWNKDATVTMGPQGAIGKAPIAAIDARVFEYRMEDMKRNLDNSMDFASIARGEMPSNIVTGKGVTALSSPSQQRTMLRLQSIDPEIERMTEDALLLWHKGGKGSRQIYGQKGGSMFVDQFDPKADINPDWCKVWVYLDAASFVDRQASQITSLQKLRGQPQAMSLQRFLELDPDCDDVEQERARIEAETQKLMQLQAGMQAGVAPTDQNLAAEKGGMVPGAPPSAAPPGGGMATPEAGMAGAAQPAEPGEEDVIVAVADLFRAIAKVRGEVWLVGDYLEGGISPEEFAEGYIEVYVSDALDKQTILNGLRNTELSGAVEQQRVIFHENEKMLTQHLSLDVSPGSQGYEPSMKGENPKAAPPEETMPPGMEPEEAMEEELPPELMGGGGMEAV